MKFIELKSSALPDTPDSVKECVNSGLWILFKSCVDEVAFFLQADGDLYTLDGRGQVLPTTPLNESPRMDEIYYFADLPRPASLSNMQFEPCGTQC